MQGPTVLLVRHGRTAWNDQRRFLGRTDIPLDDVGRAQAARLATVLPPPHAVWSSPLARARETAAALAAPRLHPGLAEMDMGELEGLPGEALLERYPDVLRGWLADPSTVVIPGGETLATVQARVVEAWRDIVAQHDPSERIAVVTHQLALASLLCALTDTPLPGFRQFSHRNTAWSVVRWEDGRVVVDLVDHAPHLEGWEPAPP